MAIGLVFIFTPNDLSIKIVFTFSHLSLNCPQTKPNLQDKSKNVKRRNAWEVLKNEKMFSVFKIMFLFLFFCIYNI